MGIICNYVLELTARSLYFCRGNGGYHPYCIFLYKEIPIVDNVLWMVFIKQFNIILKLNCILGN